MQRHPSGLEIWRFLDGKPGHENQSLGLIQALERIFTTRVTAWQVPSSLWGRFRWRREWFTKASRLPKPDLILGAGHRTHSMLIRARRNFGGRAVVLMKPSVPVSRFDLCVIPEHDRVEDGPGVLRIKGVLNAIRATDCQDPAQGLILVGGACRHVHWSDEGMVRQIASIAANTPNVRWTLTTSRRTSDTFLDLLKRETSNDTLHVVPVSETPSGWVAEQLKRCGQVWASADSVSMLYESLTSGAATGLLEVDWATEGKLRQGVERLVSEKRVTPFSQWEPGKPLPQAVEVLAEADRVAQWMAERWFEAATGAADQELD